MSARDVRLDEFLKQILRRLVHTEVLDIYRTTVVENDAADTDTYLQRNHLHDDRLLDRN